MEQGPDTGNIDQAGHSNSSSSGGGDSPSSPSSPSLAACDHQQGDVVADALVMGPACVVCLSPVWRTVVVAVLSMAACCALLGLTAAHTPRVHAIMEEVGWPV